MDFGGGMFGTAYPQAARRCRISAVEILNCLSRASMRAGLSWPSPFADHIRIGSPVGMSVDGSGHVCQVLPQVLRKPGKASSPSFGMSGAINCPDRISYACGCQYFFSPAGNFLYSASEMMYSMPRSFAPGPRPL